MGKGKYAMFIECKSNPPTCDVVHYHSGGRVSDVTWDEATKSLLPCRVPQLQPDLFGRMGKGMRGEIKENKNRRDGNKTRKTRSKRKTLWWQKVNWMKATQSQTNGKRVRWGERERGRERESVVHAGIERPPERCLGLGGNKWIIILHLSPTLLSGSSKVFNFKTEMKKFIEG